MVVRREPLSRLQSNTQHTDQHIEKYETQPEFDAAAYFGIFSCEGWGQKRMPGSNTCMPK